MDISAKLKDCMKVGWQVGRQAERAPLLLGYKAKVEGSFFICPSLMVWRLLHTNTCVCMLEGFPPFAPREQREGSPFLFAIHAVEATAHNHLERIEVDMLWRLLNPNTLL